MPATRPSRPPRPARPAPPPPLPSPLPERRLPPLLRRAWYGLNQAFRRRVVHLEITPDQYTVLRNLYEAGAAGLTQASLSQQMSSDPNTIASLVERMEAAGLLVRKTDPADRRARRLRISLAGRRRFQAAYAVATQLQEEILQALQPEEREPFLALLERVANACRRSIDPPARPSSGPASEN